MLLARVKSGGKARTFRRGPSFSNAENRAARRSSRLRSVVGEPCAKKVGIYEFYLTSASEQRSPADQKQTLFARSSRLEQAGPTSQGELQSPGQGAVVPRRGTMYSWSAENVHRRPAKAGTTNDLAVLLPALPDSRKIA